MVLHWFIDFSQIHDYLVYGVIVVVSFIEGPILALLCGILWRVGVLALVPSYIALMMGDLIGDMFWYWIGRRFGRDFVTKYGRFFRVTEGDVENVERIFHEHSSAILLVSKLTMGLGFALVTLITAGMVRIPFRRYILLNALGQLVWTAALLAIGIFLSNLYVSFDNIFARVSIVAVGIGAAILIIRYAGFVKSRFLRP